MFEIIMFFGVAFVVIYHVRASKKDKIEDEEFRSDKAAAELHKQIALQYGWSLEHFESYETHDFFILTKTIPAGSLDFQINEQPDPIDDISMRLYINFRETSFVASHILLETPIKYILTNECSLETLAHTEEQVISQIRSAAKSLSPA